MLLPFVLIASGPASPAPVTSPQLKPLEVELVRSFNSETMHAGDEILVKLQTDWTDGVCGLPAASLLHGSVLTVHADASRRDQVALEFRYGCKGVDPKKLVWLALIAPDPAAADASEHRVMREGFHSASFGEGGGLGSSGNTQANHVDLSGRQNATLPLSFPDSEGESKAKRPAAIKTGQVWKIPHVRLEVGSGPEGSTVLSSSDRHVKLAMGSVLVLLPESAAFVEVPGSSPSAGAPTPVKTPTLKLPPEIAPCVQPNCTVSAATAGGDEQKPIARISIAHLGYRRLRAAEMSTLEYGAALAFLGEEDVLFTFDPHTLVPRDKTDWPENRPHMIRALLVDVKSGRVVQTAEWRVADNQQYLWVLDGDHVIVHDGARLHWLGRGLREERSVSLDGPLAYLRIAPNHKHYAVGVLHEVLTPEEHLKLATTEAAGPEEQVRIRVLNEHLEQESEGVASSRAVPPMVLNAGRVELRRARGDAYYLRESSWTDGKERDYARMHSSCVPEVRPLANNLVMAEGCERSSNDHWLTVLREDGSPVLKSTVGWREFSPLVAEGEGGMFALATAQAGGSYVRGGTFHGADLNREIIRVHRAGDGRELFVMSLHQPLPARQPLAFSPAGDRLAMLDGDEILIMATRPKR